jgi:dihydrofolate synthase/folylpolyglutamate synthase
LSAPTYEDLVRELFPRLTGGIRWGLERTERMLEAVDRPHDRFRSVHIGGTNGKGSVAVMIDTVLRAAGLRTGLYTSPHLCSFRERVRIDGTAISESALVAAAARLWPMITAESASFFEATTAIAFLALAEANVDVAVIEVGLGGRLDSTNVIRPEVTVLTNVALDHVQLLGPTVESIAREKAGIIKRDVPVVTGETDPVPLAIFQAAADACGTRLFALEPDDVEDVRTDRRGTSLVVRTGAWGRLGVRVPLAGRHQAFNAALAVRALERLPADLRPTADVVRAGLERVRWPGRLQVETALGRTWVFDVAHNLAGVQALTAAMADLDLPRPLVGVVGVLGDKDWRAMLAPVYELCDTVLLTLAPTAPAERSWDPAAVLAEVPAPHVRAVPDFHEALVAAREASVTDGGGTILVTGSFHTVGDALIALDRTPSGADAGLPVRRLVA